LETTFFSLPERKAFDFLLVDDKTPFAFVTFPEDFMDFFIEVLSK